jgi:hypothetical protein
MRTPEADLGLLYFENEAHRARTVGWKANAAYDFTWYDTYTGQWPPASILQASSQGEIQLPLFPGGLEVADTDWAAKMAARTPSGVVP